jgi:hypothetical protein
MAKEIISQSARNNSYSNYNKQGTAPIGIVTKVILTENDAPNLPESVIDSINNDDSVELTDYFTSKSDNSIKDTRKIGHVDIKPIDENYFPDNYPITDIPPFFPDEGTPLNTETVELMSVGGRVYYKRLHPYNLNIGNAGENKGKNQLPGGGIKNNNNDYSVVSQTGTSKSSSPNSSIKIGKYFKTSQSNKLIQYEGDKIIESRFGQSIRFSGYNNGTENDRVLSPTIIIRNRQNSETISGDNKLGIYDLVEEDINKDGSIILLSSNNYKVPFQPGTIDDGGSSDFKTKPINADISEPAGLDNILINTGRIILSSKTDKMLFFSKGDYGFISDGKFTIDNGEGGADLDFGDDVNITTDRNNANFTILTGTGNILLNTTEKNERIVRGDTLVDLLSELIDAIVNQVYNTPAGPSAVGPNNRSTFNDIKSKLQDALSTLNYTE